MGRLLCSRTDNCMARLFTEQLDVFVQLSTIAENDCNEFCNNELLEINLIVIQECSKNKNTLEDILYYILFKDFEYIYIFFSLELMNIVINAWNG